MKENTNPVTIRRVDYTPPAYSIDSVALVFQLFEQATDVSCTLSLRRVHTDRNLDSTAPLVLDGVDLELLSLTLDGVELDSAQYQVDSQHLTIESLPDRCELFIKTRVYPHKNTALEGLYRSRGNYCTQCEAEGFRKITYYLDRPDVLTQFIVRIEAQKADYPVLLSNGNKVDEGDLSGGRHFVEWFDPFAKPAYLFALVAGKLDSLRDSFVTRSGREVELAIYVEPHNLHKCDYAMRSLKESMRWDEEVYGLEYDLDIFMIVAVDDFNMGAMENKGLNIFNSKFVLADQSSATDTDFMGIEAVIAHEYFHNWTGNRVTCRDWFQLSLKEGLTVFRDQQFSADMNSSAVKRIEDVRLLRLRQFPEDAGPMAHPIRPDEYMEINNFYTVTVYEKGAEVIRMMHTLLGEAGFRRGMDLYFERFDGMAVTCDDFVQAMEDANANAGINLSQFRLWYSQAGTPVIDVSSEYDEQEKSFRLHVQQSCPATPGQNNKKPFHIPFNVALLDPDGKPVPLYCQQTQQQNLTELSLDITEFQQEFIFTHVDAAPIPSLLRNFSAPVKMNVAYTDAELAFLLAHDNDKFNRWEAAQRLYQRVIYALSQDDTPSLNDAQFDEFHAAVDALLSSELHDPAFVAEALTLPGIEAVAENLDTMDIDGLHDAVLTLRADLAQRHRRKLVKLIEQLQQPVDFKIDSAAIGQRRLRNTCLRWLGWSDSEHWLDVVMNQFNTSNNMTDTIAALQILCDAEIEERELALDQFYENWAHDRLVVDKWFSIQALSIRSDTVAQVKRLSEHQDFDIGSPNRVRALIGAFSMSNLVRFHAKDGQGYELLADFVLKLDKSNPQIAARLTGPLGRWQRMDDKRQHLMQSQLRRIINEKHLSTDVYEIVSKSLRPASDMAS